MMTAKEKNRFVAGSLFIAAAVAIGAASGEWTPGVGLDTPALPAMDALPPAASEPAPAPTRAPRPKPRRDAPVPPSAPASTPETPAGEKQPVPAVSDETRRVAAREAEALLTLEGSASWYSDALAGHRTASGVAYDPSELIAAHRAFPFGTRLRVTNLANERSVEVRVIDRGPFTAGRLLDLSRSAAERIGMLRTGHARVRIEVLEYGS